MLVAIIFLIILFLVILFLAIKKDKSLLPWLIIPFCTLAIILFTEVYLDDSVGKIKIENKNIVVRDVRIGCDNCDNYFWFKDKKFCDKCGKQTEISNFKEDDERCKIIYECPKCKNIVYTDLNFCNECGEDLNKYNSQLRKEIVNIKKRRIK